MNHSYKTTDTCATTIDFDLDGDIVRNVEFTGGCNGNLIAIKTLVDGFSVEQIQSKLSGIKCGRRSTSCADQLSKAVQKAYSSSKTR